MKTLTRMTLAAFAVPLCALAVHAQATAAGVQGADAWVIVSPVGEDFSARMPKQPESSPEQSEIGGTAVYGRHYEAVGDDQTIYAVWSWQEPSNMDERISRDNYPSVHLSGASSYLGGESFYLDNIADLAWHLLVKPEFERAREKDKQKTYLSLSLRREFEIDGRPAREYIFALKNRDGIVYICADRPRMYIVAAIGADAGLPQVKQFAESFKLKTTAPASVPSTPLPGPSVVGPGGSGPGLGGNTGGGDAAPRQGGGGGGGGVDYTHPFTHKEVTRKALITFKPEPGFTEDARRYSVTGVVRFRAILNRTGEVTSILIVNGLPHGLTRKALDALKRVKFQPAQKDGHVVSQYVVFEYNFNLY